MMRRVQVTPAVRRLLVHIQECDGWLAEDSIKVRRATVEAAERLAWIVVRRFDDGSPASADITALGRAAYTWGKARVIQAAA